MTRPDWGNEKGIRCCKDCQDRFIGCHGTCEKYIAQNKAHQEELKRIYESKGVDIMMEEYKIRERYRTVQKRKRSKRR